MCVYQAKNKSVKSALSTYPVGLAIQTSLAAQIGRVRPRTIQSLLACDQNSRQQYGIPPINTCMHVCMYVCTIFYLMSSFSEIKNANHLFLLGICYQVVAIVIVQGMSGHLINKKVACIVANSWNPYHFFLGYHVLKVGRGND